MISQQLLNNVLQNAHQTVQKKIVLNVKLKQTLVKQNVLVKQNQKKWLVQKTVKNLVVPIIQKHKK